MVANFKIKYLNKANKPYFISEIGINHNGKLGLALEMIKKSKMAGFDAVKFQKREAKDLLNFNLATHYCPDNKIDNLIATIDYNGQQIDGPVDEINSLRNLKEKFKSFGWKVIESNGNNIESNINALIEAKDGCNKGYPIVNIMKTKMGKGVDFMEHTKVMKINKRYNWHAGAPDESNFQKAQSILLKKIEILQKKRKFNKLKITDITPKEVEKNNVEIH